MSPFRYGTHYADALLPVSPYTETAGTFVNCEGRSQAFNGVVKPLGETRPAWKVLRVLGSLLGLPAGHSVTINYYTRVRQRDKRGHVFAQRAVEGQVSFVGRLGQKSRDVLVDIPIHFADRCTPAPVLQQTADSHRRERA
jgi:NADH-quinone oxidoreductase subunit G